MSTPQTSAPVFEQPPASSKIPDEWSQLAKGAADAQASCSRDNDRIIVLKATLAPILAATEIVSAWARGLRLPKDLHISLMGSGNSYIGFSLVLYTNGVWVLHEGTDKLGPLRSDNAIDRLSWRSLDVNSSLHSIGQTTTYYAITNGLPLPDFVPR